MVNDVRTLLANIDGQGFATGPGEEYTDPTFRAVPLSANLRAVRAAIFGQSPDRRTVMIRTRQLLAAIHSTWLVEYVTARDPRLTYLPFDPAAVVFQPSLAVVAVGGHGFELVLIGSPPGEDQAGRTSSAWLVTVIATGGGVATVRIVKTSATLAPTDLEVSFTNGLSAPFTVPGTLLALRIRDDAIVDTTWLIKSEAMPATDLGVITARLATVGEPPLIELFGVSADEPYKSWRAIWAATNLPLPYRLGAFALALASRTSERRAALGASLG